MGYLEEIIFHLVEKPPSYVDDIFLMYRDNEQLQQLKNAFEENSTSNFTVGLSDINDRLSFFDVLVSKNLFGLTHQYMSNLLMRVHA